MDKIQRSNEGRVDIKDVELDFEESSEDNEVKFILYPGRVQMSAECWGRRSVM